jgi:8-oxo-dGTP pyrophosphatase MutT (NUDIX family)
VHEISRDALAREMREEIETTVEVGRLLWVVENVFPYRGRRLHELAFYYTMSFPAESPYRDVHREFTGHEGEITLVFRWFPIDRVADVNVRPAFLRSALADLPATPVHVVQIDKRNEQIKLSFDDDSARSPLP